MLDPENNRFDLFIVDGASNVQVVGEFVEAIFNRVYNIQGSDTVLALLFDDIANIPEIIVSDLCVTSSIFFYH